MPLRLWSNPWIAAPTRLGCYAVLAEQRKTTWEMAWVQQAQPLAMPVRKTLPASAQRRTAGLTWARLTSRLATGELDPVTPEYTHIPIKNVRHKHGQNTVHSHSNTIQHTTRKQIVLKDGMVSWMDEKASAVKTSCWQSGHVNVVDC